MAPRTRASTSVQPTRVDNPTHGGFGVGRQMAARAANLKTDHTLATPSRSRIVHPKPLPRPCISPMVRHQGAAPGGFHECAHWAPASDGRGANVTVSDETVDEVETTDTGCERLRPPDH